MVVIKNKNMVCELSEIGAEIKSITQNGKSLMWCGDSAIWGNVAPLLFPICGGLKDDKFIYDGKEYTLNKHGFVRAALFTLESQTETEATFLYTSNEDTLKQYPFRFELRVIYTLKEDGINVTFKVTNADSKTMYFSIGSHEAYSTPEGIEDYDIIFPEKETLNSYILDGNLLESHTQPIIKNSNVLPLYDKYFILDALVFKDLKSRSAILRNRKTGRFVKIDFPNKPYFLLWHKHMAPYICIEPWAGVADPQETDYDITKKEGIISLPQAQIYEVSHSITFGEE